MSTGRPIDHIVLAVDSLDSAAQRYEALGFTLTPRAAHKDCMGTCNRLVQFKSENYIELLEVDRPHMLDEHAFDADPPRFSFGAHNRAFVQKHNGISMLVFASDDARADVEAFRSKGLQAYAPFDFERQAKQPDGSQVTVAFSLGFVTSPNMPEIAFFVCQHRSPQYFWRPQFQRHENGAQAIVTIYLAADNPGAHADFLGGLFGGVVTPIEAGIRVACGEYQEIVILEPQRIQDIVPGTTVPIGSGPALVGVALKSKSREAQVTLADQGYGMFIEWRST